MKEFKTNVISSWLDWVVHNLTWTHLPCRQFCRVLNRNRGGCRYQIFVTSRIVFNMRKLIWKASCWSKWLQRQFLARVITFHTLSAPIHWLQQKQFYWLLNYGKLSWITETPQICEDHINFWCTIKPRIFLLCSVSLPWSLEDFKSRNIFFNLNWWRCRSLLVFNDLFIR